MRKSVQPGIRAGLLPHIAIPLMAVRTLPDLLRMSMIRATAQHPGCSETGMDGYLEAGLQNVNSRKHTFAPQPPEEAAPVPTTLSIT
jgi:hypothetical protein